MDSVTQIVLGAAVGEVVLGKKIGNRAMLWGCLAGTIPDLDVISGFWQDDIQGLVSHRGFSHSILFTVLSPLLFGWLTFQFYQRAFNKLAWVRMLGIVVWAFTGLAFTAGAAAICASLDNNIGAGISVLVGLPITFWGIYRLRGWFERRESAPMPTATVQDWAWLYFWGILTHWTLDAFTNWGTQVFVPFDRYRLAFDNISVADPFYTVPFIACLVVVLYSKSITQRQLWVWLGIGISSAYMAWTFWNKNNINHTFKEQLAAKNISYTNFKTTPAILNNYLWNCSAVTDTSIFFAFNSIADTSKNLPMVEIPKNHHLLKPYEGEEYVKIIQWFMGDFYTVEEKKFPDLTAAEKKEAANRTYEEQSLIVSVPQEVRKMLPAGYRYFQANDLKFGVQSYDWDVNPPKPVFSFFVIPLDRGTAKVYQNQNMPRPTKAYWDMYWKRVGGI